MRDGPAGVGGRTNRIGALTPLRSTGANEHPIQASSCRLAQDAEPDVGRNHFGPDRLCHDETKETAMYTTPPVTGFMILSIIGILLLLLIPIAGLTLYGQPL